MQDLVSSPHHFQWISLLLILVHHRTTQGTFCIRECARIRYIRKFFHRTRLRTLWKRCKNLICALGSMQLIAKSEQCCQLCWFIIDCAVFSVSQWRIQWGKFLPLSWKNCIFYWISGLESKKKHDFGQFCVHEQEKFH